jgi:phosphoserine aminotransferase
MTKRAINFNAGPAGVPLDVLKIVRDELLDYRGTGISIMESSHRSPQFDEINEQAMALAKELFGLGDDYHVLFMTGGASTQFALIPLNFLNPGQAGAYVDTGTWSTKALQECQIQGDMHLVYSSKDVDYCRVPTMAEIIIPDNAAYLHVTSNNTIKGTQFHEFPDTGAVPLMCDMSSDIASRREDFNKFSLIYAGAQKNLGPSGVTLVIIRDDLLAKCKDGVPTMFTYKTYAEKKSLYNTPPAFGVYFMKLVFEWIKGNGGLEGMEKINKGKKDLLYDLIDEHPDFFKGTAEKDSRSWMNITMRLPNEELEKKFIAEAKGAGIVGVKGHRSVGGIRFSTYNAMTLEGVEQTVGFMERFRKANS